MSHTLETLDGRPTRRRAPGPNGIRQPASLDDLTNLCNQAALEMVSESIVFFSAPTSRLVHANRAACRCLGYTRQQLRSMSLLDIAPQATHANLTELWRRAASSANQEARVRTAYRHRSGSLVPVRCSIRALQMQPESILIAMGQDASEPGSMNRRRLSAAFRDSLTLLPNRAWLWRRLEREVRAARRRDYRFAVLFIDVDRFKDINDSYGHLAGDQVLQAIARRLTASVRPNDIVARYGGDEFVVLMKDIHGDKDIRRIVGRIGRCLEAVGKRRGGKEWRARVTVSVGVAICGGQGSSAVDAVERADRAMYRAKALGRNGRFVIDESPEIPFTRREFARNLPIGQDSSDELD
jgi:diguanylate cyclase (GGDEF)-like protein/PAS domain S-box-containing protein